MTLDASDRSEEIPDTATSSIAYIDCLDFSTTIRSGWGKILELPLQQIKPGGPGRPAWWCCSDHIDQDFLSLLLVICIEGRLVSRQVCMPTASDLQALFRSQLRASYL